MVDERPAITTDAVTEILRGVLDPELGMSIVDLGMLKGVRVEPGGRVQVTVALTTAGCPLRSQIQADVVGKVSGLPGVTEVDVEYGELTQDERSALMDRARREAQRRAPATRIAPTTRVLAIASGKGGVGKSSVTANLAVALAAQGRRVGVLDADIWGFSIPRLLGVAGRLRAQKTAEGKGLIQPIDVPVPAGPDAEPGVESGVVRVVSMGLLLDDEDTALMWRGLILAKALEQFLTDVDWGELDYLLIDMPPGTGDIQMALARLLPQSELLVVTTPAKNAQKVAARVADMARRSHVKVLGIIENMTSYVAPDGSVHEIFGAGGGRRLSKLTGVELVAAVPIEPQVATTGDEGRPVVLAAPESAAAAELVRLAADVSTRLLPPPEMAGCTARIFDLIAEASFRHE